MRAFVLSLFVISLSAQAAEPTAASEAREIAANPTYSTAILQGHESPEMLLAEWEQKLDSARRSAIPEIERVYFLPMAAKAALEAGANDKARSFAEEALQLAKEQPPFVHTGQAVFYCNLVLGRLALLDGDIPKAEQYLLLSGQTEGGGALDTFGPNMSLARELLKRSRKETVLKYLGECKVFWTYDEGSKLAKWSAEIQRDGMPVFGGNLFY